MEATGWRAVPVSRHPKLARKSANGARIEIGSLVLMERPKVLTAGAVAWENQKARAQLAVGRHTEVPRTFTLWERVTKIRWTAWVWCRTRARRVIASAAPTCTLWRYNPNVDGWKFVLRPSWFLTHREVLNSKGATP